MNENTNPEVTPEEAVTASDEITEQTENTADALEEVAAEEMETADDALTQASDDSGVAEAQPVKKKRLLQIPVIISVCIVVAALLAYFLFTAFFLKEPEGVIWSTELNDTPYYFEFNNDGTLQVYCGTVEITSTYQKTKSEDGNTITTSSNIGIFYGNAPMSYTITGSRILGNQTMECSYSEDYQFTLNQSSKKDTSLDLPEDFTPDEDLLGTWVCQYFGYDIFKVTFNQDGSMSLEQVQDGVKYNGIYTITDSTVNFTFYLSDNVVIPLEYSVDGDALSFMGYSFVREGSELAAATADQQLVIPEN